MNMNQVVYDIILARQRDNVLATKDDIISEVYTKTEKAINELASMNSIQIKPNGYYAVDADIMEGMVCQLWKVTKEDLRKKTKKREIAEARQVMMFYLHKVKGNSGAKAGKEFGKDHSTVLHACKTVKNLFDTNKEFRNKITLLNLHEWLK